QDPALHWRRHLRCQRRLPRHLRPRLSHGREDGVLIRERNGRADPRPCWPKKRSSGEFMKSTFSCSRLLATALCGAALAGCDSITDVREAPYTEVPAQTAVLGGTIQGLGGLRPLVLQNNGADT